MYNLDYRLDCEINSSEDILEDMALHYIGNMIFNIWPLIRFIGFAQDKAEYALSLLFLSTPSSDKRSVEYKMGEVMICRGGSGGRSGLSGGKDYGNGGGTLTTLVFTNNEVWTVPGNIVDNWVSVRIFGGGGGGFMAGGGSGWMNNDILKLSPGEIINITIGEGGTCNKNSNLATSGQVTSFGSYLYANGGGAGIYSGGSGGAGGGASNNNGGKGYQFGGGGGGGKITIYTKWKYYYGGSGGPWGGGGAHLGNGGIYGGGASSDESNIIRNTINNSIGFDDTNNVGYGCGGKYGGGGYIYDYIYKNENLLNSEIYNANMIKLFGIGGEYGGNGSIKVRTRWATLYDNCIFIRNAENGTNTISFTNISNGDRNEDLRGNGIFGYTNIYVYSTEYGTENISYTISGGGGYGGIGYTGGGGYGGNGGKIYITNTTDVENLRENASGGAGGGGYGGDGGDCRIKITSYSLDCVGAGGGGYGKNAKGGNSYDINSANNDSDMIASGGGGGYYAPANDAKSNVLTGGAGTIFDGKKYAYGSDYNRSSNITTTDGMNGVCIVQFYRDL